MRRVLKIALATAACGLGIASSPAYAITIVSNPAATATTCANFTFSGATEIGCAGGYSNNLISGSPITGTGLAAIQALGYSGSGAYLGLISNSSGFGSSGTTINFGTTLYGLTILGIHYGGAGDKGGEATSFFSFDAGTTGITSIDVTGRSGTQIPFGLSNAALFSTGAVPEPATWGMMLLGFAGIGFAMRRSRRQSGALMQVA